MKKIDIIIKAELGGVLIPEQIPEQFKPTFKELLEYCNKNRGGFIRLQISAPIKKRTTGEKSQGNHFNGHVKTIADFLNRDPAQVKKYIKYRAIELGYPILKDMDGLPVFDLWDNVQGISEADSSREECALLIEMCHLYAAQNGIDLIEK